MIYTVVELPAGPVIEIKQGSWTAALYRSADQSVCACAVNVSDYALYRRTGCETWRKPDLVVWLTSLRLSSVRDEQAARDER